MFPKTDILDGRATIYQGHVLDVLKGMPADSVHCIATSPPYWGLRNYKTTPIIWDGGVDCKHQWEQFSRKGTSGGKKSSKVQIKGEDNFQIVSDTEQAFCSKCNAWRGQLGLEPEPSLYIDHLVQIFREAKRVLHPGGVLFVNIGDSYSSQPAVNSDTTFSKKQASNSGSVARRKQSTISSERKPKDLIGIPWSLAFALRGDGWWLRSDIIWSKPNAMPSSVTDRVTTSHEYIFMFTKSSRYYFDYVAIREPATTTAPQSLSFNRKHGKMVELDIPGHKTVSHRPDRKQDLVGNPIYHGFNDRWNEKEVHSPMRQKRSIWSVNTSGYAEAHFATWPADLVEPMIMAGSSERGVCSECGKPWKRIMEKSGAPHDGNTETLYNSGSNGNRISLLRQAARERGEEYSSQIKTLGWESTCHHIVRLKASVVLDPFCGSGTTLSVALRLGRRAIGIELNPEYIPMAVRRIEDEVGLTIPMDLNASWDDDTVMDLEESA